MWPLVLALVLVILGMLAYSVSLWPEIEESRRKKKARKIVPAEAAPGRDLTALAEKLEKRIHAMQGRIDAAQSERREMEKRGQEKDLVIADLKRQLEQESSWRSKEDVVVQKEKKRERGTADELARTHATLDQESGQRIRLEHELKELQAKYQNQTDDLRRAETSRIELEQKLKAFNTEVRELRADNVQLKKKKEAEQWVAKDDYVRLEQELKRLRPAAVKPAERPSQLTENR